MSARRKKQRRIRDLRTLTGNGYLTIAQADRIGAAFGLGPVGRRKPGRSIRGGQEHPYRPGLWARVRAAEARQQQEEG